MRGIYDEFEVINGPEDGSAYPVTRVPCHLGADPECMLHIATDPDVRRLHARITAASGGYRFRLAEGELLEVNGRRAGRVVSRIARAGDVVRAGNTCFAVKCVSEGLANRSRGIAPNSDLAFALGLVLRRLRLVTRMFWRALRRLCGNVLSLLITALALLALLSFFMPGLRYTVAYYLDVIRQYAVLWTGWF